MSPSPHPDPTAPRAPLPADSQTGWPARLPPTLRALVLLARFDRPIGWWLLYWPCLWALLLAGGPTGALARDWPLILWFLVGAIAMRGAGCVYNDIVDRDLDAKVARTAGRPLPAGLIGLKGAWAWLGTLCLVGLVVLLQLPAPAQLAALASLLLVAAYPFMKRITWWPQAWLGLVFAWGVPVGWLATGAPLWSAMLALYAGTVAWVVGYDTIYALQDLEDDAIAGVRSSARALGPRVRSGVAFAYALAVTGWGIGVWLVRPDPLALVALVPAALHLGWQVARLDARDAPRALRLFRANRTTGALVAAAMAVVGLA